MAKIIKEGGHTYWLDPEGLKVPVKHVKEEDKLRDRAVSRLVEQAKRLQTIVKNEKEAMERDILAYLGEAAKREGEEWVGGTTLTSFAGDMSVSIKVAKRWTFDERLQIAKTKIDKCIEAWSPGANSKIMGLVNRAFRVDQAGKVNAREILTLRTMGYTDTLWLEAMDLIADSMKLQGTKTYFYFQQADESGKLQTIPLDFSNL
jgi:hypothetical protein